MFLRVSSEVANCTSFICGFAFLLPFCMLFPSRFLLRFLVPLLCVGSAIFFMRAMDARKMPDLGAEHRVRFLNEFSANQEPDTDWQAYLRIEDALAAELDDKILKGRAAVGLVDRYSRNSLTFPDRFDGNWNRSYELAAAAPIGVAVLLHGLSDSPYSLLATAEALAGAGYNVVVPRMPGHGFAVGGLQQARSEDWIAATRIAVRRAMQLPASERSMIIAGYSNGGLLAVDFALRCADVGLPCPDKLVLISPAITVTRLASVANLHGFVSWMPYFEKFAWISILPEIDPFKFTSFPKRAAWEIRKVSRRVAGMLDDPARVALLPPILTFQSIVDSTVGSTAISDTLYRKLPDNGSKLIVYDVNRNHTAVHLMNSLPANTLELLDATSSQTYDLTLLRNRSGLGLDVESVTLAAGSIELQTVATGLKWPADVYSLSHIALPFRADDQIYGDGRLNRGDEFSVVLGAMAPRGERGVLTLPADFFLRARYNPFHRYQTEEMIRWLGTE